MIDRRTVLDDASPQQLAELFGRVADLGDLLARPAGQRAPVRGWSGFYRALLVPRDLDDLAGVLADPAIIVSTLLELTTTQLQLVQLAAYHGGSLSYEQVVTEAGEQVAAELEVDAEAVVQLFLAHRRSAWLTLFPGVGDALETEGANLEAGLEATNSDVLGSIARNLGYAKPPTRKAERIELLVGHLRDPAELRATVAGLPEAARAMLGRLVERHPQAVYSLDPAYRRRYWGGGRPPASSPLQVLEDVGLVHVHDYGNSVEVWTEVIVSLRGRLFESWPQPVELAEVHLDPALPTLPPAVATLDRLLALWAANPAPDLASSGIGVRAVKAAAKTLGEDPSTVATLAALAVELGLLGLTTTVPGRRQGRKWIEEKAGWAPTPLRAEWGRLHPALRWAHLVQAWPGARMLTESAGTPDRVVVSEDQAPPVRARRRVLALLSELPEGTGTEVAAFADHLAVRHPFDLDAEGAMGLVVVLRILGLVPERGPVGLTELGRRVLADPRGIVEVVGAGERTFIVQPDHTIVAPPDLEPGVLARLEDYAVRESAAGARIYRIDETRLARALDAGASADRVVSFLADHSSVGLPSTVERLVRDVAGRHGALRVGEVASYLLSEDPALLSRAVAVRPAKLRALAPTVAVSSLSRDRLVEVLRGKGLMPVAEGSDGSAVQLEEHAGRPVIPTSQLPALRAPAEARRRLQKRARQLVGG